MKTTAERFTFTPEGRRLARSAWFAAAQGRGNLNDIPVGLAYDFELRWIIENDAADGFRGSPARVEAAKAELEARS